MLEYRASSYSVMPDVSYAREDPYDPDTPAKTLC
jgi:hypothetical protein